MLIAIHLLIHSPKVEQWTDAKSQYRPLKSCEPEAELRNEQEGRTPKDILSTDLKPEPLKGPAWPKHKA